MSKTDRIAAKAARVGEIHQEHRAAIAEEAEEGAAVLDAIRDATMPALAALCSPLPAGFSSAVVEDGTPPAEKKIAQREERGFVILDAFQRDSDADMRGGRYFGRLLTLLSTGTFAIVERSGTWSSRVGERSEWTTTLREVSAREVVEEFDAAEIRRDRAGARRPDLGSGGPPYRRSPATRREVAGDQRATGTRANSPAGPSHEHRPQAVVVAAEGRRVQRR